MKKLIHVKLLEEGLSVDDVNDFAVKFQKALDSENIRNDYAFLITSNLCEMTILDVDTMVKQLYAMVNKTT